MTLQITFIHAHADLAAAKLTALLRFTQLDWSRMNVGEKKRKYKMLLSNHDNLFKDERVDLVSEFMYFEETPMNFCTDKLCVFYLIKLSSGPYS